jgi:hypothetical protein
VTLLFVLYKKAQAISLNSLSCTTESCEWAECQTRYSAEITNAELNSQLLRSGWALQAVYTRVQIYPLFLMYVRQITYTASRLGGVKVSVLPTRSKFDGWIFEGEKRFSALILRKGSKAVDPCRKIFRHVKNQLCEQKYSQHQIQHSIHPFSCLLPDDSAVRIVTELWWTNQELSSVNDIPPCLSVLLYHLGDEQ